MTEQGAQEKARDQGKSGEPAANAASSGQADAKNEGNTGGRASRSRNRGRRGRGRGSSGTKAPAKDKSAAKEKRSSGRGESLPYAVASGADVPTYFDGTFCPATVVAVDNGVVRVSISEAAKADIPRDEFSERPSVGDAFTVFVDTTLNGDPHRYSASKEKADRVAPYDALAAAFESGTPVSGEVVSVIEGGFDVDVMGVRAFLPASQVGLRPIRNQFEVLGHEFNFKIIRFNRSRYNVVLSRKVLLGDERKQTFKRLREGAIVDGVVRSVVDFGAFVDLGAVEGLLHVTDMSYGRLGHPSKLVDVGDKLTVKVLKIDKKARRISLGLKQLEDDPWVGADERYPKGKAVRGLIVSKTDFGCFIEVEQGLEGLVVSKGPMVSDRARSKLRRADIGDEIEAVVLDLDLAGRRFSLQLKED